MSEREAGALFNALGITVAEHRVLTGESGAIDLPGPFAVKLLSPDVLHKTDAGMVKLDVTREAPACRSRPHARRMREHASLTPASTACSCSRWSAG